jgi:hypothetical protein
VRLPHRFCTADITIWSGDVGTDYGHTYSFTDEILLSDGESATHSADLQRVIVCHEMMHLRADVQDNPGAFPDQSCIWGFLDHPGPVDIQLLADRYS